MWLLAAGAAAQPSPPPVYAGVWLHDVTRFDQKDGVFDVDMDVWLKWTGDLDPERVSIANAADVERTPLGEERDGSWRSQRWRVRGTLRGEFPLHRFPFDTPVLRIVLELPEREGRLVADLASSGMSERFSLTGWSYRPTFVPRHARVVLGSDLGSIVHEAAPTAVRRVSYEVTLVRPLTTVSLKLFFPLLIVLLVAMIAFWIAPDGIEARAGIGVTALLSCFAFQFTVSDSMPAVAYLTFADLLFIFAYLGTTIALGVTVAAYVLDRRGHAERAAQVDRIARVVLPVALAFAAALSWPEPIRTPALRPEPLPRAERAESARDVLRIGCIQLNGIQGLAVANELAPRGRDGKRLPLYVERVPTVSNGGVRYVAGGDVEVTWRLRPGVRWSDGRALDIDDVAAVLRAGADARIREVRTPNRREVVVVWRGAWADALEPPEPWPHHVFADTLEEGLDAVRERALTEPAPDLGPYRVLSYDERAWVMEANPHYPGAPPAIRRIEVHPLGSSAALVRAFEAGEIDLAFTNHVSPEDAAALRRRRPDAVAFRRSGLQVVLVPDLEVPALARREVRRAILHAIDRDALARDVYGDAGTVSHVADPVRVPEGAMRYGFDPDQARIALAAAGATAVPVRVLHRDAPNDARIAARVAAALEAVGWRALLQVRPAGDRFERGRRHGGLYLTVSRPDPAADPLLLWNLPLRGGRPDRDARHDAFDATVRRLIDRENRALYPERRAQLRDALHIAYSEHLPELPLLFAPERIVAHPALRGWQNTDASPYDAFLEDWHFVSDERRR